MSDETVVLYPQELTRDVLTALGAAFPEDEVEFLPRGNFEGKARALAYIDARSVMRRLDAVVGPANWSFDFELVSPDGKMVKGKLTVCGVTKCDAGEGASEDEVLKSAVSDALKRCAVHFGIGRYLYYLPSVWAPYDPRKRQFAETPRISPVAIEKALAICGISGVQPGRSVWSAGSEASVPETRGDRAAAQMAPADPNACEKCRKPLKPSQVTVSKQRCHGQVLCPEHQGEVAPAASGRPPRR